MPSPERPAANEQDETPGAFGPGYVYNPAVFGKPDAAPVSFEAMPYDGTLNSYWRIIAWAKEKGDTNALANEWIFRTPIITFPSYDARFKAVEPGDYVVWNGKGFDVWTRRS